jgi:hypothetical protein
MKIIRRGTTDEDTIVEFEDAFEAVFEPKDADRRRLVAMHARNHRPDASDTFACES